jgi:hypothetical protein
MTVQQLASQPHGRSVGAPAPGFEDLTFESPGRALHGVAVVAGGR